MIEWLRETVKTPAVDATGWWVVEDSNLWPHARQACALPAELTTHVYLREAASGFEPLNQGFAVPCLSTWLRRQAGKIIEAHVGSVNETAKDPAEALEIALRCFTQH